MMKKRIKNRPAIAAVIMIASLGLLASSCEPAELTGSLREGVSFAVTVEEDVATKAAPGVIPCTSGNDAGTESELFLTMEEAPFPDGFPKTDGRVSSYSNINQRNVGWTQLPWDSWLSLQSSGCVFLPAAGKRQSTDPPQMLGLNLNPNGEVVGAYWSRSNGNGSNVSNLAIYRTQLVFDSMSKSFGHSVRLVRDVE